MTRQLIYSAICDGKLMFFGKDSGAGFDGRSQKQVLRIILSEKMPVPCHLIKANSRLDPFFFGFDLSPSSLFKKPLTQKAFHQRQSAQVSGQ
jgi:hypothetical protein